MKEVKPWLIPGIAHACAFPLEEKVRGSHWPPPPTWGRRSKGLVQRRLVDKAG